MKKHELAEQYNTKWHIELLEGLLLGVSEKYGLDREINRDIFVEVLADMMLCAFKNGVDFEDALELARMHYDEEREGL